MAGPDSFFLLRIQKQCAACAPDQRDHAGWHWDQVAKNADGAENQHGNDKGQSGCVNGRLLHGIPLCFPDIFPNYSKISFLCNPMAQNTVKAGRFPLRFDVWNDKILC